MSSTNIHVNENRVVQILKDLIAINSVNPELPGGQMGEAEIKNYIADFCQQLGLAVSLQEVLPGRSNMIARMEVPGARRTMLFDVHMDTATIEGYPDALKPKVLNGKVFGRGACDTKGGLAGVLHALELLKMRQSELQTNIVLACTIDEQLYYRGSQALLKLPLKIDGAVVAEPTNMSLLIAHQGILRVWIKTTGKAAHSSQPEDGDNAIYQMIEVIQALRDKLIKREASLSHPLCGRPTHSIGLIKGGLQFNIVPPDCSLALDLRLLPQEDPDQVLADLEAFVGQLHQERPGLKVKIDKVHLKVGGVDTPPDAPIVRTTEKVCSDVLGSLRIEGITYATDASILANEGKIACVIIGPGNISQSFTNSEWVPIIELVQCSKIYAGIALAFK